MTYDALESGLLTVIRTADGFDEDNTSAGDYHVLALGNDHMVILMPGAIPTRDLVGAPRYISTSWVVDIELYVQFSSTYHDTSENIKMWRQVLLDTVDAWPTLGGVAGVVNAFITSAQSPDEWVGEQRRLWRQVFRCEVETRRTVAILE